MTKILMVTVLLAACSTAYSQVAPAGIAGNANFRYSLRYSEMAEFAGSQGNPHNIVPSVSLDYLNGHKHLPFSLEYAGGYTATVSGPSYMSGVFQHLLMSQGIGWQKWSVAVSDDLSYRPQSPTTGFSGIPGIGEPIGTGNNPPPGQLILTVNTYSLDNIANGELRDILNGRSTLNVGASYEVLHFPDSNGLDTNTLTANAGLDVRLTARNALTTNYIFSKFAYSGYSVNITTDTVTFGFNRQWTRSLHTEAAVGPEWVNSSGASTVPPSTGVAVQSAVAYQRRQTSIALNYTRQTSAGSGYMTGSNSNTVSASLSRQFDRMFGFGINGGYRQSSELGSNWNISAIYGGAQPSWRIGRNMNAFVNYTAMSQRSNMQASSNIVNELIQTISCGIAFTKETKPVQ
jgi:hypothetical protein